MNKEAKKAQTPAEMPKTAAEDGNHSEVSSVLESSSEIENAFAGLNVSTIVEGNDIEMVASSESHYSPQETKEESLFELDAWYGSFPEDLKELSPAKETGKGHYEVVIGPDDRVQINPTTSYPWRAICSLLIRTKTGKNYIGTGWMVGPGTVITAGHCLYLHDEGGWAQYIDVIPGRNGALRPYGTIRSSNFKSVTGWTNDKNRNSDYGAILLNTKIGNTVGYFGYAVRNDSFIMSKTLNLSGYPSDKGGSTQWFHARSPKSVSSRVITYEIDTYGGQSGSPVWYLDGSSRYAVGIHTNGHSSGNSATRIVQAVYNNIMSWKAQGS